MEMSFWEALDHLPVLHRFFFAFALAIAFAFEFINGFHDTANAVTTVIYTNTLKPTFAVVYSGVMNFVGVLLGGTAVAFSIVNLLPVDILIEGDSARAVVMVISLLLAGIIWNLATWWYGLPVSSSHTLIGSIIGVGLVNSILTRGDFRGVNWFKAGEVGVSLLISPVIGFAAAAALLLTMSRLIPEPRLYRPPDQGDSPPRWVRGVLLATCGGVSLAHGSNDGQKGMGLILLVLIGFLPTHYALNINDPARARKVRESAAAVRQLLEQQEPAALNAGDQVRPRHPRHKAGGKVQLWRGAASRPLADSPGGLSPAPRHQPSGGFPGRSQGDRTAGTGLCPGNRVRAVLGRLRRGPCSRCRHRHRVQANRGHGRREDRQGSHDLCPGRRRRNGRRRDHWSCRRLPHAREHHPCPLLRRGRHDVGKSLGHSGSDRSQDRPCVGLNLAGGAPPRCGLVQPRRTPRSGGRSRRQHDRLTSGGKRAPEPSTP